MKIAVLGTGMVGRALAGRFATLGHDVVIGTRDVEQTLARPQPDAMATPPSAEWQRAHEEIRLVPFADAGAHGEVIVNATLGADSVAALEATGVGNLARKVLVDLSLPLDYSQGMPPRLTIANTDSLGEQSQRALADARVVKTLNTVFKSVMIEPGRLPGHHNIFVAGDEASAKETVKALLAELGWPEHAVIDLGGIQSARAAEMYMQLYFTLAHELDTFDFNIAIIRPLATAATTQAQARARTKWRLRSALRGLQASRPLGPEGQPPRARDDELRDGHRRGDQLLDPEPGARGRHQPVRYRRRLRRTAVTRYGAGLRDLGGDHRALAGPGRSPGPDRLATKVYQPMGTGPDDRRLAAYHIRKACEDSLRRLQTDHIDLDQMHHIDRSTPWEEIWQAMEQLVSEGKVLHTGSSNFAGWDIAAAQQLAAQRHFMGLVSEQSLYNLTARTVELEVIPALRYYGVGLIPWSPLAGGLLGGILKRASEGRRAEGAMQPRVENLRPQLEAYEAFCEELGEQPSGVALAWLLHQAAVTATIIGPRTPEQLTSAQRALDVELSEDALARLDEIWPGPGGEAPQAYAW